MSKRSGEFSTDFSVGVRQPLRKRQRLITKKNSNNSCNKTYKYKAPNGQTLRSEFEGTVRSIEEIYPRQSNLDNLLSEWNDRMNELGIDNDISYLVSRLEYEDFELMKQITSLTKETLDNTHLLRNHSTKCIDIMLNKLEQRKYEKKEQVNIEKQERDQIRIPTKDIWSMNERINYFREGTKAAIKTQIFNNKKRKMENKYIVTKITKINNCNKECILIDNDCIDTNTKNKKKHYTESFKNIIPLPTLSVVSLAKRIVFKSGQYVLAVYPSTTCFYKAKIIKTPKHTSTKYSLKFEDDGDKIKDIEAENVMPILY
eukprot:430751_1